MMGRSRSRSRSPHGRRVRRRSTSRERHRRRKDVQRSRSRSPKHYRRSISPRRRRSHSRSPRRQYNRSHSRSRSPTHSKGIKDTSGPSGPKPKDKLDVPVTEEDNDMMKLMGFCNFDTTKGQHVPGSNNASASTIKVNRRNRQYMNRRGGFNRPLDFIA
ncbi:uncharacterized protein [Antedon mediterranea]|uniref:uncharacterized protein n=1 Tax=Antedon mediterranea TaxID=105859 RepID=UPI003AF89374